VQHRQRFGHALAKNIAAITASATRYPEYDARLLQRFAAGEAALTLSKNRWMISMRRPDPQIGLFRCYFAIASGLP
jgi:hypothetical protein